VAGFLRIGHNDAVGFPDPRAAGKRFEKIYVEIGNVCNLRCDFCPEVARGKDLMSRELFERVIADAAPLAREVCFHLMGEPLAHPRFPEFVDICAAHGLPVNITTNGTLLDEARTEALLRPVVRQVNFSVHSFASNFPGRDIGPYLEKIFAFTRRAFEVRPDLYVNYRLWNLSGAGEDENEDAISRVERAFGVALERRVDVRRSKGRLVLNRLSLHFDTRFEWPRPDAPLRSERGACRALSGQLGILSDGTVVPCCLDKEGVIALGDARRQTLGEVLAGERAGRMAQGFKDGRLVEDLCRRCTFISRFDRTARRTAAPSPA
jgi:MoaA/NifB/PqqE/SkfB family radical SAM enzyme